MSKTLSIFISILVYAITIIFVVWTDTFFENQNFLVRIAIGDLIATILVFISSMIFNNSSMYDPYWSVKPLVIGFFYFIHIPDGQVNFIHIITLVLVALYALRLTLNFYQGWTGMSHEDWRYRNFRKQFPKMYWPISFLGIHFFPSVMVYLGCLPMFYIFQPEIISTVWVIPGIILLFSSVLIAYIADSQLRQYSLSDGGKGETLKTGIWKYSRHPNYLGEILSWWGLFFIALSLSLNSWWTIIGAFTITLMFFFISIPMIEKRSIERRIDYRDYMKKTPRLLPCLFKRD